MSNKITLSEIKKIADLARLDVNDDELSEMSIQLTAIIEYIDKLNEVDTTDIIPTFNTIDLKNVFRKDLIRESLPIENVIGNAPHNDGDTFIVPRII